MFGYTAKLEEYAKYVWIFCRKESKFDNPYLFGITDGKAVGTFIEPKFQNYLNRRLSINKNYSTNVRR